MLALSFMNREWFWPVAVVIAVSAVLVVAAGRKAPPGITRWLCPALKILGITALGLCLLEPMGSGQRARPGANLFAVVADNSQGMRIKDRDSTTSRSETLQALLTSEGWLDTLQKDFEVRRYYFDARLRPTETFEEMSFDGRASAIGLALGELGNRLRSRPLAGILLLTDGNATDLPPSAQLPDLPPVYPVLIGKSGPARDIALQQVRSTQTDFEDAPVSIDGELKASGYAGQRISARLLDASGKQIAEQQLRPHSQSETLAFHFRFRPEKQGLSFYRLELRASNELASRSEPDRTEEATLANNSRVITVQRGRGTYRILYVAGRPNWEYKFLNRALDEDDQVELVGLIRVARREPKFNFIGRTGETSNPLFRGFGNQSPEEIEQYDQPVLVRLNTRDEAELHAGFPRTEEELYAYHAVIVDDLEAAFFTPDQATLMQKFVSERGGGFLMLGGMECFQQGKYDRTPIGDMLPVYLDPLEEAQSARGWRMDLTREGSLQSWARLRDNEADENARLLGMPELQVLNRVREVKPGAIVVATASDPSGKLHPALVAQRFGNGRTGALLVGDLWRWGLRDAESHRDMDKAWRQLIRWLVTDVPNRVDIAVEPQPDPASQGALVQVRVRDEKFQPLDDARVTIEVAPALVTPQAGVPTNIVRFQPEASGKEPGLFESVFVPRLSGGYRVTAWATNSAGMEVGRMVAGWSAEHDADECRSLEPNPALLEKIARSSGGRMVRAEDLRQFVRGLPRRQAPVMESWVYPLWHTPMVFGFALACLISEWGLRRWKGLP